MCTIAKKSPDILCTMGHSLRLVEDINDECFKF